MTNMQLPTDPSSYGEVRSQPINMENVMALTARLAQIMAQEVDYLTQMDIEAIEPLQNEKNWLTKALELQLKRVRKYPHLLEEIGAEDRAEFRELVEVFEEVKQENFRRLKAAKEVNERVVQAITEVVNEQNQKPVYSHKGKAEQSIDTLSVTLNKKI